MNKIKVKYSNFSEASKATGIAMHVFTKGRKEGVSGLTTNYVNYDKCKDWLEQHRNDPDEKEEGDGQSLREKKLLADIQYKEEQIKKLKTQEEMVRKERIREIANELLVFHQNFHKEIRKLFSELPYAQMGLSPEQVKQSNLEAINKLCERIQFTDEQGNIKPI